MHANGPSRQLAAQGAAERGPTSLGRLMLAVTCCGMVLWCSDLRAFQTNIRGTAGAGFATAVALDPAGDVVAGGTFVDIGTDTDFVVAKFSGFNGTEIWRRVITGTAIPPPGQTGIGDQLNALAVDQKGDVIAAGATENAGTKWDFTVVKLSGVDGRELWRRVIGGALNGNDTARAVSIDAVGDVIAAGVTSDVSSSFTVVKFSGSDGAERWRKVMAFGPGVNSAFAVSTDAVRSVIAAGAIGDQFAVVKLSSDGAELWSHQINNGFGEQVARSVQVNAAGDVVAAGTLVSDVPRSLDFAVVKLSGSDGGELWRRLINGTGFLARDAADVVAIDSAGNAVAAGLTLNPTTDLTVVKCDGLTGDLLWRKDINGSADFLDEARSVALDGAGDVLVAGNTWSAATCQDFTAVKLSASEGAVLWRRDISGSFNECDQGAAAIAAYAAGDAVVAGGLGNGPFSDFSVVKLKGTDGGGGSTTTSVVSELVGLNSMTTSFDSTPVAFGPAGTFTVDASFTNTSATAIDATVAVVTALSHGNLILNPDDSTRTAGARLTPDVGSDGILSPGEPFSLRFVIGLRERRNFKFLVEFVGTPGP